MTEKQSKMDKAIEAQRKEAEQLPETETTRYLRSWEKNIKEQRKKIKKDLK